MAGVQFRRQDNMQKPPRFRCSIVCRIYSPSGDAFLSPGLSISAPILLDTLGACPLVCGAGAREESVAASGTVATGGLFGAVLFDLRPVPSAGSANGTADRNLPEWNFGTLQKFFSRARWLKRDRPFEEENQSLV